MSIEAFWKTHIVMTQEYGYYVNGRWEKGYTPLSYTKGNIQPWKKGESFQTTDAGLIFNDVLIVYVKRLPEFVIPEEAEQGEDVAESVMHVWIPDTKRWYAVKQVQNWTRPGRGSVTHFKLFVSWTAAPVGESRPSVPISQESVEAFLNETYELEQAVKLV